MKTPPGQTRPSRVELLENRIAPAAAVLNLATLNGTNGITVSGVGAGDSVGAAVSGIGDINGDEIPDFVVSAPNSDVSGENAGSLSVVFGNADGLPAKIAFDTLNGTNGFIVRGRQAGDTAGTSVSEGDVNGDGFGDLIFGAPYASPSGTSSGAVYVVFGKRTPFTPVVTLSAGSPGILSIFGEAAGDRAGSSVGSADFNNDGRADIIIGAPGVSVGGNAGVGATYVVFGTPSTFNTVGLSDFNGFEVLGQAAGDHFGANVSGAGDVNGDGFDDIILGALDADSGQPDTGAAYVIFGRAAFPGPVTLGGLNGINGFKVQGEAGDDRAGASFSAAGDLDGDLLGDIIIGAPGADPNGEASGAAYVIYGARSFPAVFSLLSVSGTIGFKIEGGRAAEAAGASISYAGDFNNDGIADLIIGAPGFNGDTGAAYLLLGSDSIAGFPDVVDLSSLDGMTGFKISGIASGDVAGISVSSVGDLNGDDFDDIIIGASRADAASEDSGAAYVVYGFDTRLSMSGDGQTFSFTEADGDVVTLKISRGGLMPQDIVLAPDGSIETLDLTSLAPASAIGGGIKPLNISINVKTPGGGSGNGVTKVGFLDASGVSLGKLKLKGDLGRLFAGAGEGGFGAKSISVLGNFGNLAGPPLLSEILGGLGKFNVQGNLLKYSIRVEGNIKSVNIGGDFIGDPGLDVATLADIAENGFADSLTERGVTPAGVLLAKNIAKLKIGGSMKGGAITATKKLGAVSISSDLQQGSIFGGEEIAKVKVLGRMTSADPNAPATITARNKLNSLVINGDVENARILVGYNNDEDPVNPDARVGKVLVKGDWTASSLVAGIDDSTNDGFGRNDIVIAGDTTAAISRIASVVIKGTATGSAAAGDHFGITAQQIGKVSINGELVPLDSSSADNILLDTTNNDFRVVEIATL